MPDTIDLLEAIGSDALLRHASAEELTKILEQARASEALTAAAASGEGAALSDEFGHRHMYSTQVSQGPGHEEEEREEEPGDGKVPRDVPVPERDKSPLPR